jgi:hypothetical protein
MLEVLTVDQQDIILYESAAQQASQPLCSPHRTMDGRDANCHPYPLRSFFVEPTNNGKDTIRK